MLAGQGRAVDGSGVVVKAHHGIELRLRGGSAFYRAGDLFGVELKVAGKARIALLLGPHCARANAL